MNALTEGATGICRHCEEKIMVRSVRTGREWVGPFWANVWVHVDNGVQRCWSPWASPVNE